MPPDTVNCMTARVAAVHDSAWIVAALNRRREPLVQDAPVFWRPAPDASSHHRAFLDYLLTDGGAVAYRTDDSVLVAAPRGDGWLVDDFFVDQEKWMVDGRELWAAFSRDCHGSQVRFVCPAYEKSRGDFAQQLGLTVSASWWLKELPGSGGGDARVEVALPGAQAVTVAAPPVYAPPGPILFLPVVTDAQQAVPAAVDKAPDLGCAAVVVNVEPGDADLTSALTGSDFRRHCDYYVGVVGAPDSSTGNAAIRHDGADRGMTGRA
jgi:hypothetical protein